MWLINFLPGWFFHLVLLAGLMGISAGFVLRFIPFVSTYQLPIKAASAVLIVVGLFMEGAMSNEQAWQLKVAEAEKRALVAEAKAAKQNVKIVTKAVEDLKVVTDTQVVVQKEIADNATAIDTQCVVPPAAIAILNQSATARQGEHK